MSRFSSWLTALLASVAFATLAHTLFSPDSYPKRQKTHAELERLRARNVQLRDEVEQIRAVIAAHRSRPEVRSRAARDELNVVESRDVVFDFRGE